MRGIYVDRWRYGTHSPQEIDDLLAFCDAAGIQDIFLQFKEDRAVSGDEHIAYALQHRGTKRIHLWTSLTLGRNHEWERNRVKEIKGKSKSQVTMQLATEGGTALLLNPKNAKARSFVLTEIERLLNKYPELYGLHIDKLNEDAHQLVTETRSLSDKYLSIPFSPQNYFCREWDIDEAIPMVVHGYSPTQLDQDFHGCKRLALGCYSCDTTTNIDRIKQVEQMGMEPILYSYGTLTQFKPTETYQDFVTLLHAK